jgi:hypothetical protein
MTKAINTGAAEGWTGETLTVEALKNSKEPAGDLTKTATKTPKSQKKTATPPKKAATKAKDWEPIGAADRANLLNGYVHFTAKTTSSLIAGVGVRLGSDERDEKSPYVALSVLGAGLNELDYTEGGAAAQPKPRQVKAYLSGPMSPDIYNMDPITAQERAELSQDSLFVEALRTRHETGTKKVPPGVRQVIVKDVAGGRGDVSLSPIGAIGLNGIILARLQAEQARRQEAVDAELVAKGGKAGEKKAPRCWAQAVSPLGGSKPQNVGIQCTGDGGIARAQFAWWQKSAPSFPKQTNQRVYSALFRGASFTLSKGLMDELKKRLDEFEGKPSAKTEEQVKKQAVKIVGEIKEQAKRINQDLSAALIAETTRHGIGLNSIDGNALKAWQEKGRSEAGEALDQAWLLTELSPTQKGWLLNAFGDINWSKGAAKELTQSWRTAFELHLSVVPQQKLEFFIAEELRK